MKWDDHKAYWPNADKSRFVTSRPHIWHVQEAGTGQTILLLHGAGASTHSWRDIIPRLAKSYHVLAVDLPGQGFTKLGSKARCGLNHMAEDLAALLDHLDVKPNIVIGHSAGAAIALRLGLTALPETTKIVSINGALGNFKGIAGVLFPVMAKLLALNPLTSTVFAKTASSAKRVENLIASTGSTIDPDGLKQYQALISDKGHVDATLTMMAQWSLDQLMTDLPRVGQHVLFLVGENDSAVPPETSKRAADLIQNATFQSFSGFGHLLHEQDPDAVICAINTYLRDNSVPSVEI